MSSLTENSSIAEALRAEACELLSSSLLALGGSSVLMFAAAAFSSIALISISCICYCLRSA